MGTREGGLKARETNKLKYGANYYAELGRKGGRISRTGGFYANRALAARAGRKGGAVGKRRKKLPILDDFPLNYELVNQSAEPLFEVSLSTHQKIRAWVGKKNKEYSND